MKLGVVVLNYNNYEETKRCVNSLLTQKDVTLEIVIVDNGSKNDSYTILKKEFGNYTNIHLISSKTNLGYAKGNNLGIKYLKKKQIYYIFVANSDIYFPVSTIMKQIVDGYAEGIGLIVPVIKNTNGTIDQRVVYKKKKLYLRIIKKVCQIYFGNTKVKNNTKRDNINEKNKKLTGLQTDCYIVSGSGFLLTPDFFLNYEGLFSKTFLYFEEWATIILLHKSNLLTKVVDNEPIIHKGGASSYNGKNADLVKLKYMKDSSKKIFRLIFMSKRKINKSINMG